MLDDKQIYHWIARASSPRERVECNAFTPLAHQDEIIISDRIKKWQAVLKDNHIGIDEILTRRQMNGEKFQTSVLDVEVTCPDALPKWAKNFHKLIRSWADIESSKQNLFSLVDDVDIDKSMLGYSWGFLARIQIDKIIQTLKSKKIYLEKDAISELIKYFLTRIYTPVMNILGAYYSITHDSKSQNVRNKEGLEIYNQLETWIKILEKQPVLSAVIGEIYCDWFSSTHEMLVRLEEDITLLTQHFFNKTSETTIVKDIKCGLGDPHRGGRSVAIIKINLGEIVYKPKNLLGTNAIGVLLEELHVLNPDYMPLAPEFLNQGDYGWEQKVSAKSCKNKTEVNFFYQRLGAWLRLLQILNANDFWYDNLIASKDMPYFIDYETVIGTPWYGRTEPVSSLAGIGILPMSIPAYDKLENPIDISCMVPPGKQRTPFQKGYMSISGDEEEVLTLKAVDFAVYLNNKFEDINPYFDSFQQGFRVMNKLITTGQGQLAFAKFLSSVTRARFRHIFIDTWSAYNYISSINRNYTIDGVRRAIAHDILFKAVGYYPYEIIETAIESIKHNDIPIYEIQSDNTSAYTFDNQEVKNQFEFSPINYIKHNIEHAHLVELDLAYVRSLYAMRYDSPKRPYQIKNDIKHYKPLEVAYQIGDNLLALLDDNKDHVDLYSITLDVLSGNYSVRTVSYNFDGLCALIIFFARLYRLSHRSSYYDALEKLYYLVSESSKAEQIYLREDIYGIMSAKLAQIVAYHELSDWFDVDKKIASNYQSILSILTNSEKLYSDYRLGLSGLLSVLAFSRSQSFNTNDYLSHISEQLNDKKLIIGEYNSMMTSHLESLLPSEYLGRALVKHYWRNTSIEAQLSRAFKINETSKISCADLNINLYLASVSNNLAQKIPQLKNKLQQFTPKNLETSTTKKLINSIYNHLYFEKYHKASKKNTAISKQLKLVLINRFVANNKWFCDTWAEDKHLLSALGGMVDIGLSFLAEVDNKRMLNPARMIEL